MDMLTVFLLVTYCHVVHSAVPSTGPISYRTTKWNMNGMEIKFASRDDSVMISCQTDQPYAKVFLYKRDITTNPWRNVMNKTNVRNRITVLGQTFAIKSLTIRDSGYYRCFAENWDGEKKELIKGQLVVNPVKKKRIPEIFPDDPIITINVAEDKNITCTTIGAAGRETFLTWYRRDKNGTLTEVDKSNIHSKWKMIGGNHIDIEKLMFKDFKLEDVGEYVCERKVYEAEATQKIIRIETNVVFAFKTRKWLLANIVPVKMALVNDFLFISCQTNTLYADVSLMRKGSRTEPWEKVSTSDTGHVMQIGQTFLIKRLSYRDSAKYKCEATNEENKVIELEKGRLIASVVRSEKPPGIIPKVPVLLVKRNEEITIVCQADGIAGIRNSFIRWYRKNKTGDYIYVNESMISKEKRLVNGKHRDIHTMKFKTFRDGDVGEYACVRKVSGGKPTNAFINVKIG